MNQSPENQDRAESARMAVVGYKGGGGTECDIIDILSDIRHLCDAEGLDYDNLSRIAGNHHLAEVEEG